jgi:radical SAM protein with 4Fe4S-binding SPASM domain
MTSAKCQQGNCPALDYLKFAVTYRCNLSCRFCLQQFEKKLDLSWANFEKALVDAQTVHPIRLVIFTGGEPLLWPHLEEAIEFCKQRGVPETGVFTNGILLDDERAARLKALGVDWFRVSIYGSEAAINDSFLRQARSFDGIVAALAVLQRHGFRRKARVTIMKPNLGDVAAIIEKLHDLEVEEVDFRVFSPTSVAAIDHDYELSRGDVKRVIPLILKYQRRYRGTMDIKCLPGCYDFLFREEFPDADCVPKCQCGRTYMGVTAEGNMRVCFGLHNNLGNIAQQGVEETWRHAPMLKTAREFAGADECASCIFLRHCRASDCFAASYNKYGDVNRKNPLCPLERPIASITEWEHWKSAA